MIVVSGDRRISRGSSHLERGAELLPAVPVALALKFPKLKKFPELSTQPVLK